MDEEIGYALNTATELIIHAALVAVIAVFSIFGTNLMNKTKAQSVSQNILQDKSRFYLYDDTIVTGSDVIDVITQNARLYKFTIDNGTNKVEISSPMERQVNPDTGELYGREIWTIDYLTDLMGQDIQANYSSTIKYVNGGIESFNFKKE